MRSKKPWVLVVSHFIPEEGVNGAFVYTWRMMQFLRRRYRVVLFMPRGQAVGLGPCCYDARCCGDGVELFQSLYWRVRACWQVFCDFFLRVYIRLRFGQSLGAFAANPLVMPMSQKAIVKLDAVLFRYRPVAVIANYAHAAVPALLIAQRHCRALTLINSIDCQSARMAHIKKTDHVPVVEVSRVQEKEILDRADVLIAIQKKEQRLFVSMLPQKEVIIAPCPFDVVPCSEANTSPGWVLMVGGTAQHNQDGLAHFMMHIWPVVRERRPDAELHVCGNICASASTWNGIAPGVVLHGYCAETTPYYAKASVVINPCIYGSGLKIKNIEAMAHGKCLLTTPVGVQGLEPYVGEALLLAETADFAQTLIDLLSNQAFRERIGHAAQECVAEYFSEEACFAPLLACIGRHVINKGFR